MAYEHSEHCMTVYDMRKIRGEITVGGHDLFLFTSQKTVDL